MDLNTAFDSSVSKARVIRIGHQDGVQVPMPRLIRQRHSVGRHQHVQIECARWCSMTYLRSRRPHRLYTGPALHTFYIWIGSRRYDKASEVNGVGQGAEEAS